VTLPIFQRRVGFVDQMKRCLPRGLQLKRRNQSVVAGAMNSYDTVQRRRRTKLKPVMTSADACRPHIGTKLIGEDASDKSVRGEDVQADGLVVC